MIAALLFLQFHSIKNRLRVRVQRLRQPKYLFGAIVGGAYFYFYFVRHLFASGSSAAIPNPFPSVDMPLELLGAFALFVVIVAAWVFPHQRAALAFSEAEVAFLFPAPVSRRTLIHFKLLKSQTGILVSIIFLTLISRRFSGSNGLIHAAGWWIILSMLNLHFLGASFARTLLLDRGISNWTRRLVVLLVVAVMLSIAVVWGKDSLPTFTISETTDLSDIARYLEQLLQSGPLPYVLFPFQIVVQPFLAPDAKSFLVAAAPALLLLGLHYWWVVRSNVAFEESSVEMSRRVAEKIAAVRSGNWQVTQKSRKKRRPPFVLQPLGLKPIALLWKNLISAGQMFSVRMWTMIAIFALISSIGFGGVGAHSGILMLTGFFAMMLLVMSLLAGPQLMRQDFRQDLPSMDVLKTYPLPGWQIVLGEILAPVLILTSVQWLLLIIALGVSANVPDMKGLALETRIAFGFGVAVIIPTLNLISLLIPNAAILLFPAWFQAGKDAPTGIEAMGQRIIFVFGQVLVLTLALAPAAAMFAVTFIFGKMFLGLALAIPIASVVATIVLAVEGFIGLNLLGKFFERFDLSAESTN